MTLDEFKVMMDDVAKKFMEQLVDLTCPLPTKGQVELFFTAFNTYMAESVAIEYQKIVQKCSAEVLNLPEDSSTARIQVAIEDLAKDMGGKEEAYAELNRRLDERFPMPQAPVAEDTELSNTDPKDFLN